MTKAELRRFLDIYEASLEDPVHFVRTVLNFDTYDIQDEIIRSVFNKRYTAVRSCHASGKTASAAACVLAWLYLHPPGEALVITTSSDWNQVERGMWREIRLHISKSIWPFPHTNLTDLTLPNGSQAFGISTNDASNWHGFHNRYVLLVIDEAAGLDDEIFSALKGIQSGGDVHTIYLMNPTETSGPSVDLFEDPEVNKFVIDGLKLPNMRGLHLYDDTELNNEDNDPDWEHNLLAIPDTPENDCELDNDPRDYLLRRREIRKRYYDTIREYGSLKREAVDWWARIRGEFPIELQTQLIKKEWVDRAHTNRIDKRDSVTVVGIDVAGAGTDLTAICVRNGYQIIEEHAWPDEDCYDKIINVIGPPRTSMWLHVDAVAIGWGLCRELLRNGYQVKPCNAKEIADDNTRFAMKKAEWYWNLRELFRGDEDGNPLIGGPINPITQQQLASIRWDQKGPHGTVRIESKDDMKKRGLQCLDVNTPIPTPNGWVTMADLQPGDFVFDHNGIKTKVLAVSNPYVEKNCYLLKFSDDSELIASYDHLWLTRQSNDANKVKLRTTEDISKSLTSYFDHVRHNHFVPMSKPLEQPYVDLPISPYLLGVWLGDGYSSSANIVIGDLDTNILTHIENEGYEFNVYKHPENKACFIVKIGPDGRYVQNRGKTLRAKLNKLGVLNNKHIPNLYLNASITQRIDLLCGLLDTDGCVSDTKRNGQQISYCTTNMRLADNVLQLCRTLGIKTAIKWTASNSAGKRNNNRKATIKFQPPEFKVFKLERKANKQRLPVNKITEKAIIDVTPVAPTTVKCIKVESENGLFLAGHGYTVTHNSPDRAEALMLAFAGGPYNISTRQLIYDSSTVISGNADVKPATVKKEVMPQAVDTWLKAAEQARVDRRKLNINAIKNLIKPQETAMYDSNGKFLGYKQHPLDPVELKRLEGMLEPG